MAKIPYLIRRKNVFYFRLGVPAELREAIKSREIIQSLRTESSQEATLKALKLAAPFKTLLHDLQNAKQCNISLFDSLAILSSLAAPNDTAIAPIKPAHTQAPVVIQEFPQAPLLSVVVDDFLKRYDQNNKATFTVCIAAHLESKQKAQIPTEIGLGYVTVDDVIRRCLADPGRELPSDFKEWGNQSLNP